MSLGGYRPGSGRKKGSVPWNKGVPMEQSAKEKLSLSKKGTIPWNKGVPMKESTRLKLLGNNNGKGNKGRKMDSVWIEKLRQAKLGKKSKFQGRKHSTETKKRLSEIRRANLLKINPNYDYILDSSSRPGNRRIRRERLKKYGGSHTNEEWEDLKESCLFMCVCCKRKEPEIKLTRDHIIPLSSKGTDDIKNIQPLCNQCNAKKATQTIRY